MKKKIVITISILLVILAAWLSFSYYKEYSNNLDIHIKNDSFQYKFREGFKGAEWKLFVNEQYVSYVTPFEGYSQKEMKEHLANEKLIKCLYDEENIRIYCLPWRQYESKYEIIYTLDGSEFYSLSYDVERYKEKSETKQRLDQLYEKYPKEELKKRAEESWE